jgi:N-acetylneuraminate lyase
MAMTEHLTGLTAPPPTPMHPDGSVNLPMIDRLARRLIEDGLTGAFVCGSTGETASLSVEERKRIAERWAEAAGDQLRLIIHVGHNARPEACELAEHAKRIGAFAAAAVPPSYFKPAGVDPLIDFLQPIAEAAGDRPLYYYHIPRITGVHPPLDELLQRGREAIPTLAGMKFTDTGLPEFQRCLALGRDRFDLLFGVDEMLLAALAVGATGAVGTTYNFAAPLYHRILDAFRIGDMETARTLQHRAAAFDALFIEFGRIPATKAILAMQGLDCGPPRSPLTGLNDEQRRRLHDRLAALLPDDLRLVAQ